MIWKELWRAWDDLTTTDLDEKVVGRIAGSIQTPDTSILTSSFVLNNQAEQKRKREDWFAPKGPASRGLGGIRNTQDASDITMGIDIKLLMMMRSMNEGGVGVTLYLMIWPRHFLFWRPCSGRDLDFFCWKGLECLITAMALWTTLPALCL